MARMVTLTITYDCDDTDISLADELQSWRDGDVGLYDVIASGMRYTVDLVEVPAEPLLGRQWQMQRALALLQLGRAEEARTALAALGVVPPDLAPLASPVAP